MAAKQRTYTIRNKMTGEIVGYWDNLPGTDEGVKASLRREFGQGRFQITYTGRKKSVDADGVERWVTHPVNQFFIVGNPQSGIASFQGQQNSMADYMRGQNHGGEYRDFILPFVTETRNDLRAIMSELAAMSDTLASVRASVDSLMTDEEGDGFGSDEPQEKGGFGLETLATNPKYAWAIPLVIAGDKDALINGVVEKMKTDPTLLHDFIADLVGGAMGGE